MAISDLFIGGYQWQMMLMVYAMLALPVAALDCSAASGNLAEKRTRLGGRWPA